MSMKSEQNYDDDNSNNGETNSIGSCQKLKLLFWKNWILQWNQKLQLLIALILPILFLLLIVLLRTLVEPISNDETRYPSLSISDLFLFQSSVLHGNQILHENGTINIPKHVLCYTPSNNVTLAIVRAATRRLRLLGWRSYESNQHMEYDLVKHNFIAGVHFRSETMALVNENGFPIVLNFTLRFPSELRTMHGPIIETWQTHALFPRYDLSGPRNSNASDGGVPTGYLMEGFLPLQHAITMSWLQLAGDIKKDDLPEVRLQRFPYIAYIYDPLLSGLQQLLPFILLISFIYPCTFVAKYITSEKELQLKEMMKLMGLYNWLHWTAWFVKSYLMLMMIALLLMCLLLIKFDGTVAILTYTNWLPLLIFFHFYVATSICFCFMIAVFFSRASTAAAITGILWFLTYIPYSFAYYYYGRMNLFSKLILSCLFSNTALGFGFHVIISLEGNGEGVQLSNLLQPVSEDDTLTLLYVIVMLILGSIIYMTICLYVEQIYPGAYGAPRPWNYPFSCKFWREIFHKAMANLTLGGQTIHANCRQHREVGIELLNLQKCYGQNTVVKNLNLKLYRNEITVLLGHNGAGKTTTLHMLTGIIPPTEGTALINGWNIRTQVESARQSMGICPQHNVLFDDMSVRNHIVFFSRLKGIRGSLSIKQEVDKYMRIMELEDKSYVMAEKLSGGMKRKLSLCCALCGNTRAILCDEPSSGIDVAGRRRLWDLLLAEKMGRTILLTTHYMDEANVLGDRIAILANGELQCYGTPFELKKRYGLGYRLVCVMESGCNVNDVTKVMANHIPNIQPESTVGSEVIYRLPNEYSSKYAALLSDLDSKSDQLKLDGYGISVATIEDVFVQMNMKTDGLSFHTSKDNKLNSLVRLTKKDINQQRYSIFDEKPNEQSNCNRFIMHWQGLIYKNVLITFQNYWILIIQLALPIIFTVLTILNSRGGRIYYALPEMHVSLKQYQTGYVVLEESPGNRLLAVAYAEHVASYGKNYHFINTNGTKFEDFILAKAKHDRQRVDFKYLAGLTIAKDLLTIWLNNKPLHTAPLTLNLLHNGLARQFLGQGAKVDVSNEPLPYSKDTLTMRLNKGQRLGAEIAMNLSLCMSFITAFFVLPVIKERASRAKLLQYLTGIDSCSYWMSQWLWDYLIFTLTALLSILTIATFQELGYSTFYDLSRYLIMLLVFGISALPLSYVIAGCFSDGATGFTRTAIVATLSGTGLFSLVLALSFEPFQLMHVADRLTWFFRVFPHYCLANGLHRIHIGFNIRRGCSFAAVKKLSRTTLCEAVPICCNIPSYFGWQKPGILPEIVYLLVTATCFFLLLLIIDTKMFSKLKCCCQPQRSESLRSEGGGKLSKPKDKDGIEMELLTIKNMSLAERKQMPLIVDSISKRYGKLLAVNKLSFYVANAECFGLMGINGAGKTSTFKMLTGDTTISSGTAFVQGLNLRTHMRQALPKIGYCPQFNALFEELTGRQTLRIYCLLRCIPRRFIGGVCVDLAMFFGFQQYIDKRVKHYSGGNKRKLSVAIAFIGNPLVLYLDEPTCGMDPTAQRQLWQILSKIRNFGKSTVLTTHSMEECEALCTRIAIMISGEIKCIGSIQQIKNNYSEGQILKIKVKMYKKKLERRINTTASSELSFSSNQSNDKPSENVSKSKQIKNNNLNASNKHIQNVKDFIEEKIPGAILKEEHNEQLTYYLPIDSIVWSEVFQLMESNRYKLHIEDYVITQTRLEEIFLNFVWNK